MDIGGGEQGTRALLHCCVTWRQNLPLSEHLGVRAVRAQVLGAVTHRDSPPAFPGAPPEEVGTLPAAPSPRDGGGKRPTL